MSLSVTIIVVFQNVVTVEGGVFVGRYTFAGGASTTRRYIKDGRLVVVSGCLPPPPPIFFQQLHRPTEISLMVISGHFPWGKPAATESRYPTYSARSEFQCFHNSLNSNVNYRIFNVCV